MSSAICAVDEYSLIYSMIENKTEKKKDKKQKKEKDPNRWAVDPVKAAAKAEKAAKAKAEKAARDEEELALTKAPATPIGEKKRLAKLMAKSYDPTDVEKNWQEWWEKSGWYGYEASLAQKKGADKKFVMVIPPPNVTGSLHLGHALTAAIEDSLARWHRMRGDATLYVPGTDHAGIATQSVVEKQLAKQNPPVSRHDLGREQFINQVWKWKEQYGSRICQQLRRLASSVDWNRERFTMDPVCAHAVTEAFVQLHDAGLMYRDSRLINWSCSLKSAISDLEVDYIELEGADKRTVPGHPKDKQYEFGMFTEFAYKVIDPKTRKPTGDEVIVATTRLETMLGDVAVAVHPNDPRYKKLHGMQLLHPFFPHRQMDIILDDILVDMNLGTGCVKITPAHDPNDYECGKRHSLPFITIFSRDGTVVQNATPFIVGGKGDEASSRFAQIQHFPDWIAGQPRYEARIIVENRLKQADLFRDKYPKPMRLALCSRSGDIIEPLVQPQWFVDCNDMARRACDAVRSGELSILPKIHEKTWFHWLENVRPWCVSRQLWWGHQVPAWFAYAKDEDMTKIDKDSPAFKHRWIVARNEHEANIKAIEILKAEAKTLGILRRDEDVLDTWFSSGLFPFSVFGWPEKTPDFEAFYPTTLLETGLDILFFWVARMVMLGLQLTNHLPFTTVYLHAMVRDKEGRKMSKSLGNVIDPLEVIDGCSIDQLIAKLHSGNLRQTEITRAEKAHRDDFPDGIPKCGTDALRAGLLAYTVQGRDINLDVKRVVGYRMFCNKLWNALRFVLGVFGDFIPPSANAIYSHICTHEALSTMTKRDRFILSRLSYALDTVNKSLNEYAFADVVQALYAFFLNDLCDVYLELVKPIVYNESEKSMQKNNALQTLWICLDAGLRALHPICPFVTEELWQRLPRPPEDAKNLGSIMTAAYPTSTTLPPRLQLLETDIAKFLDCVTAGRSLRNQYNITNKTPAKFFILLKDVSESQRFNDLIDDFSTLVKAETTTLLSDKNSEVTAGCALKIVDASATVLMDLKGLVDIDAEILKLRKQIAELDPLITKFENKRDNPAYTSKCKPEVLAKEAEKLTQYTERRQAALDAIKGWEQARG
mmetsp:Transcript_6955/g.10360  ORF Transcript_6955/g.10360 Transcript_6955/m.10360 type:complete len:1106 (-) Transcript_6955:479-3796(-)